MNKKFVIALTATALTLTTAGFAQNTNDRDAKQGTDLGPGRDSVQITNGPNVNPQSNSASISWTTNKTAATNVSYGTTQNNLDQTARQGGGSRDHNVTLSNLQPGTTYFFAIKDDDGRTRRAGQFTTQGSSSANNQNGNNNGSYNNASGQQDNVVIQQGPTAQNVTPSSAQIVWVTDDVAATDLRYGTDQNNLSQRAYERGGNRNHSVQLSNLQPGQTYYFQLLRRDGSVRTTGSFTTGGSNASNYPNNNNGGYTYPNTNNSNTNANANGTYPKQADGSTVDNGMNTNLFIHGPTTEFVNDRSAVIAWSTQGSANSIVHYGTNPYSLNQQAQGAWGNVHRVTIQNLQPNTNYYFQVESSQFQGTGQSARSNTGDFQTVSPGAQARTTPFQP